MAKSSTKKSQIDRLALASQVDWAINTAIAHIDEWANKEFKRIVLERKVPVLLPMKNGVFTGNYYIRNENDFWSVYTLGNDLVHEFTSKRAAVSWCFAMQTNNIKLADNIKDSDDNIGRVLIEVEHYKNSILHSKDILKREIASMRMKNKLAEVEYHKNRLSKNLERAKYLKIPKWDN